MFRYDNIQTSFFDFDELWERLIPQNSKYRLFRELAPILVNPEDLKGLYCHNNGRPSHYALKMTLACLLQQMHGESDRDMERQTQVNLEFKYALGMGVDEPGIDACSLLVHRKLLIEHKLDKILLHRFVYLLYYLGILSGDEPFLTDTTHAIAPVSESTVIELVRQGMLLTVRCLKKYCTSRVGLPKAFRYLTSFEETKEFRLEESAVNLRLQDVVVEADELIQWAKEQADFLKDKTLQERLCCLDRILRERIVRNADGTISKTDPSTVKDLLVSAHDIEARFGCKGKIHWRGYKVATVQVGDTGFLAAADALAANQHDGESLSFLVDELPLSQVKNPTIIGDTHYGAAEDRLEMASKKVRVIAPVTKMQHGLALEEEGFVISSDHQILTCPQEYCFTKPYEVKYGHQFHLLLTKKSPCNSCPLVNKCFGGKKRRTVFIHKHYEVLLAAEKEAKTSEFRAAMKLRARIEAKQNELANHYGLRRTFYSDRRNLVYAARMRSLGANFSRLEKLFNDRKHPLILDFEKARTVKWPLIA